MRFKNENFRENVKVIEGKQGKYSFNDGCGYKRI